MRHVPNDSKDQQIAFPMFPRRKYVGNMFKNTRFQDTVAKCSAIPRAMYDSAQ